jgi:hypothetical protein
MSFTPWLLMIMISFCPCTGNWQEDNTLPLHTLMLGEQHCEQEAERIRGTWQAYQLDYPNVRVKVMCRADFPANANGFSYEVN